MFRENQKRTLTSAEVLACSTALESHTTVADLLVGAAEQLGMTFSCYIHFPAVGAIDFNNSGVFHSFNAPQFIKDNFAKTLNYSDYPILSMAMRKGRFAWLSDSLTNPAFIESSHNKRVQQALNIIGDSVGFPLFGPDNRKGFAVASFGRDKNTFDPAFSYQLHGLMQIMHIRYCRLIGAVNRKIKLSPREAEVLELISYGKTNAEIAQILGISTRTIDGHASRIFIKLGVNDRVSAAMRAQTITVEV